jgi:hypothetical protein
MGAGTSVGAAAPGPDEANAETGKARATLLSMTTGTAEWVTAVASVKTAREPPPKANPCFTSPDRPKGSASSRTKIKPPAGASAPLECQEPLAATPANAATWTHPTAAQIRR